MRHAGGFNDIGINASAPFAQILGFIYEFLRKPTADLRHFKRMRETVVKDMAFIRGKNLRNACEPAKRSGEENAVTVSLAGQSIVRRAIYLAEPIIAVGRF